MVFSLQLWFIIWRTATVRCVWRAHVDKCGFSCMCLYVSACVYECPWLQPLLLCACEVLLFYTVDTDIALVRISIVNTSTHTDTDRKGKRWTLAYALSHCWSLCFISSLLTSHCSQLINAKTQQLWTPQDALSLTFLFLFKPCQKWSCDFYLLERQKLVKYVSCKFMKLLLLSKW